MIKYLSLVHLNIMEHIIRLKSYLTFIQKMQEEFNLRNEVEKALLSLSFACVKLACLHFLSPATRT